MLFPCLPTLRHHRPDGTLPTVIYFVSPSSRRPSPECPGRETRYPLVISYLMTCPTQIAPIVFSITKILVFQSVSDDLTQKKGNSREQLIWKYSNNFAYIVLVTLRSRKFIYDLEYIVCVSFSFVITCPAAVRTESIT